VIVGKPWFASAMTYPFYQYGVEYSNGYNHTLDFYFGDPDGRLHGPYRMDPPLETWVHVAYTYDGSTVRGYLDGAPELSAGDSGSIQRRGHSLRLGVDGAYQQFMNGVADDLRIYSRALSQPEVQSAMLTAVGGGPAGMPGIEPGSRSLPVLSLEAPNPFHPPEAISFVLPVEGDVDLRVFDSTGRLVRVLEQPPLRAGRHSVMWSGADASGRRVPTGWYFIRLRTGGTERTASLVLIR
jgi:hypothetical protein